MTVVILTLIQILSVSAIAFFMYQIGWMRSDHRLSQYLLKEMREINAQPITTESTTRFYALSDVFSNLFMK